MKNNRTGQLTRPAREAESARTQEKQAAINRMVVAKLVATVLNAWKGNATQ